MNRVPTTNMASITAADEWIRQVKTEMKRQHITQIKLAKMMNFERKAICNWLRGASSPKLENAAQICALLGMKELRLPLEVIQNDSIS